MQNNLSFFQPLEGWKQKALDDKKWLKAKKLFDEKKYEAAIEATFFHFDKKTFKKYQTKGKKHYLLPTYKNWIEINIENEKIDIQMEVVKVSQENFIFISRKILELNTNFFSLPKITLDNDLVKVSYSCYTDSATPLKIGRCLREFGRFSSIYTEEFLTTYQATLTKEPKITYYTDEKYKIILQNIKKLIEETNTYCDYFDERLQYVRSWDTVFRSLLTLDAYLSPKGELKKEIDATLDIMWDKNIDSKEQFFSGLQFINKLKEYTIDDLRKYVFSCEIFLNRKKYYNTQDVSSFLSEASPIGKKFLDDENYIGGTLNQTGWLLCVLYNAEIESEGDYKYITKQLIKSSNIPWKKSAQILTGCVKDMVVMNRGIGESIKYYIAIYFIAMALIYILKHI